MGKHEVGTPKYIANKIKAKGLQKLRWYCQMCQKQCRDENGFKCHTMSESHHRQLLLFSENSHKYMDGFSKEFSDGFLHLLKRQFGTKRVSANRVYQEYITDRDHIHMNATRWLTLTGFVKWLGKTKKCEVDETEKGWFITYIDRDPETLAALEKKEKKEKMDRDDEERMMAFIEKQVKKAKTNNEESTESFKQPLERPSEDTPLVLDIKLKPKKPVPIVLPCSYKKTSLLDGAKIKDEYISEDEDSNCKQKRKVLDNDSEKNKKKKIQSESSNDIEIQKGWLKIGLCVKIVTQALGEKYYKAKGTVKEILNEQNYYGKVKLKSPEEVKGYLIKIDQEHLETVIPSIGREVMILSGKYEDELGFIDKVRIEDYSVDVELKKRKKLVKNIPYEHICKYVGDED